MKIFKLSTLAARGIGIAAVIICGFSAQNAQAGYIVTLTQQGSDVVASGSGAVDLTGLSLANFPGSFMGAINPGAPPLSVPEVITGPAPNPVPSDIYSGTLNGPTSFGNGGFTGASSGNGDLVGFLAAGNGTFPGGAVFVPSGYVSGNPLSDTSTYDNATLNSLGVKPGTYVWTWGTGANQNFTLRVGAAGVPDSDSTLSLLLIAGSGLSGLSRFRSFRSA